MSEDKTRETIAELKDVIASRPAYKSVTLTEVVKGSTKAAASDGQSASDTIFAFRSSPPFARKRQTKGFETQKETYHRT